MAYKSGFGGWWKLTFGAVLAACMVASAAPSQLELTVDATQRRVVKLNRDLDASVEKLNQTTQDLVGRVNDTDGQAQQLQDLMEGNQQQIVRIERSLAELRSALFAHFNITDSAGMWSGPTAGVPEVRIEPPSAVESADENMDVDAPQASAAASPKPPAAPVPSTPSTPAESVTYGDPDVAYQKGVRAYADGDYAMAYDYFRDYTVQYPQGDRIDHVNWRMAMCLLKQARYQQAVTAFEDVRERFPNSDRVPYAMQNQAVAHASLGQISKAEELLEAVIQQFPVTPPAAKARENLEKLRGNR